MELEFSGQFFEKYPNIKFHENPSIGSRVVTCGSMANMTKLIAAFANLRTRLKFCIARQLTDDSMVHAHTCCIPKAVYTLDHSAIT
jgi:hypothetical protein